jgi:hypothetical protein
MVEQHTSRGETSKTTDHPGLKAPTTLYLVLPAKPAEALSDMELQQIASGQHSNRGCD